MARKSSADSFFIRFTPPNGKMQYIRVDADEWLSMTDAQRRQIYTRADSRGVNFCPYHSDQQQGSSFADAGSKVLEAVEAEMKNCHAALQDYGASGQFMIDKLDSLDFAEFLTTVLGGETAETERAIRNFYGSFRGMMLGVTAKLAELQDRSSAAEVTVEEIEKVHQSELDRYQEWVSASETVILTSAELERLEQEVAERLNRVKSWLALSERKLSTQNSELSAVTALLGGGAESFTMKVHDHLTGNGELTSSERRSLSIDALSGLQKLEEISSDASIEWSLRRETVDTELTQSYASLHELVSSYKEACSTFGRTDRFFAGTAAPTHVGTDSALLSEEDVEQARRLVRNPAQQPSQVEARISGVINETAEVCQGVPELANEIKHLMRQVEEMLGKLKYGNSQTTLKSVKPSNMVSLPERQVSSKSAEKSAEPAKTPAQPAPKPIKTLSGLGNLKTELANSSDKPIQPVVTSPKAAPKQVKQPKAVTASASVEKPKIKMPQVEENLRRVYELMMCVGLELTCNSKNFSTSTIYAMLGFLEHMGYVQPYERNRYKEALTRLMTHSGLAVQTTFTEKNKVWEATDKVWVYCPPQKKGNMRYKLSLAAKKHTEILCKRHGLTPEFLSRSKLDYREKKNEKRAQYKNNPGRRA